MRNLRDRIDWLGCLLLAAAIAVAIIWLVVWKL